MNLEHERSGLFTGWLQKKKSGSAMLRMRQYNKRFFSIDFDNRVVSYAHSDKTKKVACVVAFADLLEVRLGTGNVFAATATTTMADDDVVSECSRASKTSRTSFIRRMSSFRQQDREVDPFLCLIVVCRPNRIMELLCSSSGEVESWLDAFKAAKELGGGGESSTQAFDAGASSGSDDGGREAGASARARGKGRGPPLPTPTPTPNSRRSGTPAAAAAGYPPSAATASHPGGQAAVASGSDEDKDGKEAVEPPPKAPGVGFLDFDAIEEEPAGTQADSPSKGGGAGGDDSTVVVVETSKLQASDFGLEMSEGGSSSSSSSSGSVDMGIGVSNAGCDCRG
mmetsp:Transcript_18408/g.39329  ORF Transcript_18408/g.39329 Transcript_18408/m.39329 type:complete len:339 (-) Transcript_18408:1699-2715(-)